MIHPIFKFSTVVVLLRFVVGEDIKIWPEGPDYILEPDAQEENRTFVCNGNVAIQWYFEKFDKNLVVMMNYSMEYFIENRTTYYSIIVLNRPSYLNTGYYYCAPVSAKLENVKKYEKIYIYVKDLTHLFADPEDLDLHDEIENGQYRIPCRPTSPDVNVTLKINDTVVKFEYHSTKKITFTDNIRFNCVYTCEAKRNNSNNTSKRTFTIPVKNFFSLKNMNPGPVIIGKIVQLNCSGKLNRNYKLRWIVQNKTSIEYKEEVTFNATHGNIHLTITNMSVGNDNTNYTCEINDYTVNYKYSDTFTLNIAAPNVTYIDMKMLDGKHQVVRPAGFRSVHWKIQISANQKVEYEWADPDNNIIETIPPKILVNNSNTTSNNDISYISLTELTINDLQVSDSGIYKLLVINETNHIVRRIDVTLLVEEKPSVMFLKSVNKDVIYYEFGKIYSFEFYITGYPLPIDTKWYFESCQNFPWCKKNETQVQIIENGTIIKTSEVTQKFILSINATVSGTLICNASNSLGNSSDQLLVFVSDVKDGFDITGPSDIANEDNVTFMCGASRHGYIRPLTISPNIIHNQTSFETLENETEFTIYSYYTVIGIPFKYGNISCTATRKAQSNNENENIIRKELEIIINNQIPAIILTNDIINKDISYLKEVKLTCRAGGMPLPKISWFKDDTLLKKDERVSFEQVRLTNGIESNVIIKLLGINDDGTYKCEASNKLGTKNSFYYLTYKAKDDSVFFKCLITILLGLFVIGCILCYLKEKNLKTQLRKGKKIRFKKSMVECWNPELDPLEQVDLLPYDEKWEFPKGKLKLDKKLGSGAFGDVYKGYATGITDKEPVTTVAVKTVKSSHFDKMFVNALESELKIMSHIGSHVNVVNLLGACTTNISKNLMVIVEYCRYGNIQQYLLKHRDLFINQITPDGSIDYIIQAISKPVNENLPNSNHSSDCGETNGTQNYYNDGLIAEESEPEWRCNYHGDYAAIAIKPFSTHDLICWSFQIACGMNYLASKKILHGDLAARNTLLAEGNVIKICDFGLAKSMYDKEYYKKKENKKELLPYKWMAIESLLDRVFSSQSDVWSFGIVMWEIFSLAAVPYPNFKYPDLLGKLIKGYRMDMPKYANTQLYNIMKECWNTEPKKRPLFIELVDRLGDLLEDGTKSHYIDLNEYYEKLNAKKTTGVDLMKLMTKRRDSNSSIESEDHKEFNLTNNEQDKEHNADRNEIEMKPIVHNKGYDMYKS